MNGKWNNKTKRYEYINGKEAKRIHGDDEDSEEMRQIEKIEAEGGTYLERYSNELDVNQADLLKDILANNSMDRFNSVRSYEEFTMLKQTLVKEKGLVGKMKEYNNMFDSYTKY